MGSHVMAGVVDAATLGLFSLFLDPVSAAAQDATKAWSQSTERPTEAQVSAWQEQLRVWQAQPEVREVLALQALLQNEGALLVNVDERASMVFVSRLRWHADSREFVVDLRVPLVTGANAPEGTPLRFRCETRAAFVSPINEKMTFTQYSMRCEASEAQAVRHRSQ